jgi:hypothetical protein
LLRIDAVGGNAGGQNFVVTRCLRLDVRVALLAVLGMGSLSVASAATGRDDINPCRLLTTAEISAVVDRQVGPGRFFDGGQTGQGAHTATCLWLAPLPAGARPKPGQRLGGRGFIILNIQNWANGPSAARKFLDDFDTAFRQHDINSRPVAVDVGADDAIWWGDGVAGRKGAVSFGISVAQTGDRAARRPRDEALARLLVKRLPAWRG